MRADGITVVKTPNAVIASKKARCNDKHYKEQYAYRRPKTTTGIPAKPAKPATIQHCNQEAQEQAWRLYNEVKDRMTYGGKPALNISKNDFFVTDGEIENVPKRVMDMCFASTTGMQKNNRKYMLDSGATFHLICWQFLSERERLTVRKCSPCLLNTANGPIEVGYEVDMWIEELDLQVTAFILKDSPPLLSMGKLCRMHGFVYVWNGMNDPVLYDSKISIAIQLMLKSNVPFLLPEITNEPLLKTPVNTPRQVYDAKNADAVQLKEINAIIHGVENYGHEQCSINDAPSGHEPEAAVELPTADGVKQIEDELKQEIKASNVKR